MTKQQEVEILSAAIKQLGPDSYLGPWLVEIKAELADLIKTDIFPDITLKDAIDSGNRLIARAKCDADDVIAAAQLKADALEKAADEHRNHVSDSIHSALSALKSW